jgi:tRNA A37 threonylcarbamoyladenosine synthetase subunit TsaC/SUA5/YrdC
MEPPTTASGAVEQLGSGVDVVVDGGKTHGGEPSTVLDLSGEELWIIRAGPVKGEEILRVLRA